MKKPQYGTAHDLLMKKRLTNIKEMLNVVKECDNDFTRALKLRRIYPSFEAFRTAYFPKINDRKGNISTSEVHELYANYEEELRVLESLYKRYEDEGFFKLALKEEAFLLRQEGDIDSRVIINAYINDFDSYDPDVFYTKYKIDNRIFRACSQRIEHHDEELYQKFLEVREDNKTKRLVMPIYSINQIIEGINTGKTIDGKPFDIYEFYRLAPFKYKNIDEEVRAIGKDFPKILEFKKLKQEYKNSNLGTEFTACTYMENLYLFTKCFNSEQAEVLRDYMVENNVRNLTPIYRIPTVKFYTNTPKDAEFNMDDANAIFDYMNEVRLPYFHEVYSRLKQERMDSKKAKKPKKYTKKDIK